MKPLILIAAAAALLFKDEITKALSGDPAVDTAQKAKDDAAQKAKDDAAKAAADATAAKLAAEATATKAAQDAAAKAAADAAAKAALIPPTIQVDNPTVHNGLVAQATVYNAAALSRAQTAYNMRDTDYRLTVNQWNWYHTQSGLTDGVIIGPTEVGDNAIPASQYLALRIARGLTPDGGGLRGVRGGCGCGCKGR